MRRPARLAVTAVAAGTAALAALTGPAAAAGTPTCADTLGVAVHGQHVVSDYVIGLHGTWPPSGGVVGHAVAGRGAAVPGGPGPGFHFVHGVAPGASFCTGSASPGAHL